EPAATTTMVGQPCAHSRNSLFGASVRSCSGVSTAGLITTRHWYCAVSQSCCHQPISITARAPRSSFVRRGPARALGPAAPPAERSSAMSRLAPFVVAGIIIFCEHAENRATPWQNNGEDQHDVN